VKQLREIDVQEISFNETHVLGKTRSKCPGEIAIQLDRDHSACSFGEGDCQGTAAGADLDEGFVPACCDRSDQSRAPGWFEEVLTEPFPRAWE
jgi:hypothetical protein